MANTVERETTASRIIWKTLMRRISSQLQRFALSMWQALAMVLEALSTLAVPSFRDTRLQHATLLQLWPPFPICKETSGLGRVTED
jgi:hypothetical protein